MLISWRRGRKHVVSPRDHSSAWAGPRCASEERRWLRAGRASECSRADAMALHTSCRSCTLLGAASASNAKLREERQLARTQALLTSTGRQSEGWAWVGWGVCSARCTVDQRRQPGAEGGVGAATRVQRRWGQSQGPDAEVLGEGMVAAARGVGGSLCKAEEDLERGREAHEPSCPASWLGQRAASSAARAVCDSAYPAHSSPRCHYAPWTPAAACWGRGAEAVRGGWRGWLGAVVRWGGGSPAMTASATAAGAGAAAAAGGVVLGWRSASPPRPCTGMTPGLCSSWWTAQHCGCRTCPEELNVSFTPGPYAACMRKWGCRGRTRCCAAVRDGGPHCGAFLAPSHPACVRGSTHLFVAPPPWRAAARRWLFDDDMPTVCAGGHVRRVCGGQGGWPSMGVEWWKL